jgi:hypothetical protein
MEEVRQTTTTEETTNWDRDRAFTLTRALWRDFGPLVVGALVLIVVLVGGWTLFKKTNTQTPSQEETIVDQQAASDVTLPESTINLGPVGGSATPTPTPTATPTSTKGNIAQATPTATPSYIAMGDTKGGQPAVQTGKGGQNLPKTGPEVLYGLVSLASISGGYFLLKKSKDIY